MPDEFSLPSLSPLDVADWRIQTFALYAEVRENADLAEAHLAWQAARNEMVTGHPASPLPDQAREGFAGLTYADYDPAWRLEAAIEPAEPESREVTTGTDGVVVFERVGVVRPEGLGSLDVWRLSGYGGGIFIPVKDSLAGRDGGTYGAGRYLIDSIKGAHLGMNGTRIVLDFNFAYNPSCAYDPAWACPLAQPGNVLSVAVPVGELYAGGAN